ncbi:MAG: DUF3108 domain-containing protein, partial [Bacteroidales bacterium]|nr:DUF3108 domain-containing protein [Bacteroidales bacterium]
VGKCTANVHPGYFKLNNRDCFKVDVFARTVGVVDWIVDVENEYRAYVDTVSLLPQMFYRKQREGKYSIEEQTEFDQKNKQITVRTFEKKSGQWAEPVFYDATGQIRDMISGFLFLRAMDLPNLTLNDTIKVAGFFEDEVYQMQIVHKGEKTINTKMGKIKTLVFKPIMPKNKLFDGKESITLYFSDDKNRIPIKFEANMFIGKASLELIDYSGLRNPLNIVKAKQAPGEE